MAGLCEGGNEPAGSLKAIYIDVIRMDKKLSDERAFNIKSFSQRYCRPFAYVGVVSRFPPPAFIRQLVAGLT
ncbi:hypothetical protein ANN_04455 [Periplaneta americana]|uniref:Uncharacterized protein n=1 Tax=Periplaneta americana TaxID=6978 RepID=A0ABQ8TAM8_PERAM|nr:hypothetical protein ANN_04455 [Periplaneta americana]